MNAKKIQIIKMLNAAFPSNDRIHLNWSSIFTTGEFVALDESVICNLEDFELTLHSDFIYNNDTQKEQEMFYIKLGVKDLSSSVGIVRSDNQPTVIDAIGDFKSKLVEFSKFINYLVQ